MTYISPSKVFAHLDRLAGWQDGETPAPVTIEWDLSNVCSLGCKACHFAHTHVAGPWAQRARAIPTGYGDTGRLADPAIVERALGEMAVQGVQGIVWSGGGEPTLHPAFADVVSAAAAFGLQQGMYTLGGHVSADIERAIQRFSWVVVSLDAADSATYAKDKSVPAQRFGEACRGISVLSGAVPVVGVSFLLHQHNWTRVGEMHELARMLGATYSTFRPEIQFDPVDQARAVGDRSWITEALPTLREMSKLPDVEVDPERFAEYRDWTRRAYTTCHGVKLTAVVTPDSRMWVCPQRRGIEGSCLGNLSEESFGDIWARHPAQWTDLSACRVMCRLHLVNRQLAPIFVERQHEAFV